jgi:hypothetical protein
MCTVSELQLQNREALADSLASCGRFKNLGTLDARAVVRA